MHRLTDGQVKHSPEVFYAGSLWKVFDTNYSVLSFSGVPSIFFPSWNKSSSVYSYGVNLLILEFYGYRSAFRLLMMKILKDAAPLVIFTSA